MLTIEVTNSNGKTRMYKFIVIDAHSHIGKDVDGAEMMNPNAPNGTFDFWTKTESMIENMWNEGKMDQSFSTTIGNQPAKLTIGFEPHPIVLGLYRQLETLDSGRYGSYLERIQNQRLFDQGAMFPFQDEFRDKMPEALYRASNINVHRTVSRFPTSIRTIGYMRCDPMEGKKAVQEMEYVRTNLQIRGMKLHPRSEGWIDHIASEKAVACLLKAAEYQWPVIFDTRGKQSILDIGRLIDLARNRLESTQPELLPHLKVIIAHFAQGNVGDEEVYRTITKPNTYGDLSMLHGKGAGRFFADFREWFKTNQIKQLNTQKYEDSRDWSEYLLFASDYPYFGAQHAKGLMIYVFNKEFYESGGTLQDTANILGLNQLKLLPEYSSGYISALPRAGSSIVHSPSLLTQEQSAALSSTELAMNPTEQMLGAIADLVHRKAFNIEKILFQYAGTYENYQNEALLVCKKKTLDQEIPVLMMNLVQNHLNMLGVLPEGAKWTPLGYENYYNPETRKAFNAMFQQTWPAKNPKEAADMLEKILS